MRPRTRWTDLILVAALGGLSVHAAPEPPDPCPSAESLLARCMEAMGGRERIQQIRSLQVTWRMRDGKPLRRHDVERPRRLRSTSPGGDWRVVFDGTRICAWGGLQPGDAPGPRLLTDPEKPEDFDIDLALLFPAVFEYPTTSLGMERIDGIALHRLRVLSPHGVELVTFLDAKTFLPVRLHIHFTKGGETYNNVRLFSDFRNVEGLLYPHTITGVTPQKRYAFHVEKVVLNPVFPPHHFAIPEEAIHAVPPSSHPPER